MLFGFSTWNHCYSRYTPRKFFFFWDQIWGNSKSSVRSIRGRKQRDQQKNLTTDIQLKDSGLCREIASDVEDYIRTLDSVTRLSVKLRAAGLKMQNQAEQIRGFAEETNFLGDAENPAEDKNVAELNKTLEQWETQFESIKELMVSMIKSGQTEE